MQSIKMQGAASPGHSADNWAHSSSCKLNTIKPNNKHLEKQHIVSDFISLTFFFYFLLLVFLNPGKDAMTHSVFVFNRLINKIISCNKMQHTFQY